MEFIFGCELVGLAAIIISTQTICLLFSYMLEKHVPGLDIRLRLEILRAFWEQKKQANNFVGAVAIAAIVAGSLLLFRVSSTVLEMASIIIPIMVIISCSITFTKIEVFFKRLNWAIGVNEKPWIIGSIVNQRPASPKASYIIIRDNNNKEQEFYTPNDFIWGIGSLQEHMIAFYDPEHQSTPEIKFLALVSTSRKKSG